MTIACAAPLPNGEHCGIDAQGRCHACGDPFCGSHRALTATGLPFTDYCAPCQAREQAAQALREQEAARHRSEERTRLSAERGRLTQLLLAADGASFTPSRRYLRRKRAAFFSSRDVFEELEPAIEIGPLKWTTYAGYGEYVDRDLDSGITRTGEVVAMGVGDWTNADEGKAWTDGDVVYRLQLTLTDLGVAF